MKPGGLLRGACRLVCCAQESDGFELGRWRSSLLQERKAFPPKSLAGVWLAEHEVVARFFDGQAGISNPWERRDALAAGIDCRASESDTWFSIGHMSCSPYSPLGCPLTTRGEVSDNMFDDV